MTTCSESAAAIDAAFKDFSDGNLSAALRRLESLVERDQNNFDALNGAGIVAGRANDFKKAAHYMARALAINPKDLACAHNLAVTALKINDLDKAEHAVKLALAIKPDAPELTQLQKLAVKRRKLLRLPLRVVSPVDLWPVPVPPQILVGAADHWFALSLKQALAARGVIISDNPDARLSLFLHGVMPPSVRDECHKMIWVRGNPDQFFGANPAVFDHIFSMSPAFTKKLVALGLPAETLIGGVNIAPVLPPAPVTRGIVFVGNARHPYGGGAPSVRPIVKTMLSLGDKWVSKLEIWGQGWRGLVPSGCIKGDFYDYRKLNGLYGAAMVTLNDHQNAMREGGFPNPRILDVMAAGGVVVSDNLAGAAELFGDALPVYRTAAELDGFLARCFDEPEFRAGWIAKGRKAAADYSFAKVADQLVDHILAVDEDVIAARRALKFKGHPAEEAGAGDCGKYEMLADIHHDLAPRMYLETGVGAGASLALAKCEAVGIDPMPKPGIQIAGNAGLISMASDDFFSGCAMNAMSRAPDLALIDGMHLFEYALRDFMGIERIATPWTVAIVDGVFPAHPAQAGRERRTKSWAGDVWKLCDILARYRPDLMLLPVNSAPAGMLLIVGLNAENEILHKNYAAIAGSYAGDFTVPAPALNRDGIIKTSHNVVPQILRSVARAREQDIPREEMICGIKALLENAGVEPNPQCVHFNKREKTAVYTALAGAYDDLKAPEHITPGVDYICFADRPDDIRSDVWQIRRLPLPPELEGDNNRLAKAPKVLAHKFLPDYDIGVWVDCNVNIHGDLVCLAADSLRQCDMAMFRHPENRPSLQAEVEECVKQGKDDPQKLAAQLEAYQRAGIPPEQPVPTCSVIIRRHNREAVAAAMEDWWREIMRHSRRDQVSFPYIAWRHGLRHGTINQYLWHNRYFTYRPHNKTNMVQKRHFKDNRCGVLIVYPRDGWILERMARELIERIPGAAGVDYQTGNLWDVGGMLDTGRRQINYFINYAVMRRRTAKFDVGCFTHPEKDGKFQDLAKKVDFAVCMCDKYRDQLSAMGTPVKTIIPGVSGAFSPRLRLGFIGRLKDYSHRKGADLLIKAHRLPFVALCATDGGVDEKDLPAFYNNLDYVLVTSRYEGGPMCILEGLASGKKIICPPDIGFAGSFARNIIPYENGNWDSLCSVLTGLYQKRLEIARQVSQYTWDHWASEHAVLFDRIVENLENGRNGAAGLFDSGDAAHENSASISVAETRMDDAGDANRFEINRYAAAKGMREINLHLGCGGILAPGWINIDFFDYENGDSSRRGAACDLKMDIRKLAAAPGSVDKIMLIHVLEHFVRWQAVDILKSCHALLKNNGKIIMEHPDLDQCIVFYKEKDLTMKTPLGDLNMGFTQFYGNQWDRLDYETHRYVWTKKEMRAVLESLGYKIEILDNAAKFHVPERDMRVVASKRC